MPNIIYYSRAIHRCPQNTRGTCHVSTNVSWSRSTLESKKSKNRNCLIWLPPSPASGSTRDHWDMSHTAGPILQQKKRQGPPVRSQCQCNGCNDSEGKIWQVSSLSRAWEGYWRWSLCCSISTRQDSHYTRFLYLLLRWREGPGFLN